MKGISYIEGMKPEQALIGRIYRAITSHKRANGIGHRARAARQAQRLFAKLNAIGGAR